MAIFVLVGLAGGWMNERLHRLAIAEPLRATPESNLELTFAAVQGVLFTWLVLGLPFALWIAMRRQSRQGEALRNLSQAMEQSHSAVMIVNLEGEIEFVNRGLCRLFGSTPEQLRGSKWSEFAATHPAEAGLKDIVTAARLGQSWEGEWSNPRDNGVEYTVHGVVTPVKRPDGAVSCVIAMFDDVTETKRREAELREARDHAQAGDQAKGKFLATMSHEVRTPLNGIAGFTSLLLETRLTDEQHDYVQTIKMSTEALIQLTGDVLDFARIESGRLTLDPIACDPRECVEDALDFLAAKAAEKKIELLHRVAPDVPAAMVIDGGRLRQVLANLIGNAVKFTDKGEVEVSVQLVERQGSRSPHDSFLEFTVRDTGIGIAPEHHGKLFRPFTQVDESTTRRYGGTGLGLAICRSLITIMGGHIHLTSEPGRGSCFTFTIRAPVAAALPPPPDLHGMRVGLAIRTRLLRTELADLVRSWQGEPFETESPDQLRAFPHDAALVELDEPIARNLIDNPAPLAGLSPETTFGLVPISLSNDLRTGLRAHFRLLVNKPVHHGGFFALLSGTQAIQPPPMAMARFGFRVLVVDDNPVNQRLIERVLSKLGCTATTVNASDAAMEQLAKTPGDYDLVLLDLQMPEKAGAKAVREIRAGNAGAAAQRMWIIALTTDDPAQANGDAEGLNDLLPKPLQIDKLESALRKFRSERMARKR